MEGATELGKLPKEECKEWDSNSRTPTRNMPPIPVFPETGPNAIPESKIINIKKVIKLQVSQNTN